MALSETPSADERSMVHTIVNLSRKTIIFIAGTSVLLVGVIMIVTPGPAFLVIPAGLAILGTEFLWARRRLDRLRDRVNATLRRS